MEAPTGFDAQVPSLPDGGGAVGGLGEIFTPDLSTGSGSYAIPLDCPNGPNDIGPRLVLHYSTAAGNGPFGLGFALSLPRLLRSTARGYPRFDDSDRLILEGAGELVRLGDGMFRPQVDAGAWRAESVGQGFRLTDRAGNFYDLGQTSDARLMEIVEGGEHTFAWHLERIEDPLGYAVTFTWERDGGQLYLQAVAYGAYRVEFHYEVRNDISRWSRAGFQTPIKTARRCAKIELHRPDLSQPLLRRWSLGYTSDATNGISLLTTVTLTGFDERRQALDAPALSLGYTHFQSGDLEQFEYESDGPCPLGTTDRRIELVDWNGNGLPDLLEISEDGMATLWPNVGALNWLQPESLGERLPLFGTADASIGLLDMDGDGVADLVRLDKLCGYIPRHANSDWIGRLDMNGDWAAPVEWSQVPSVALNSPMARLVDLDGDGRMDLMASSMAGLELYYRDDQGDWGQTQTLPPGHTPIPNLDDEHVFLADMTGDGSADIVRVDDGSVKYWPYMGMGRWGDPVLMGNALDLPSDWQSKRLFLGDVDGDGCADLFYLDAGQVLLWINQCGNRYSMPFTIPNMPLPLDGTFRLADMRGSCTAGVLWSVARTLALGSQCDYYYLEFCSAGKPYLLNRIDNSLGLVTEVDYTTSAQAAADDARDGNPWTTFLPVSVPIVKKQMVTETTTGRVQTTQYRYRDGRYDGVLREFAGFAQVEQLDLGDATVPTLRTVTKFDIGIDVQTTEGLQDEATRLQRRATRGRIVCQERFGLDNTPQRDKPYDRLEQNWVVVTEDTGNERERIYIPRLVSTIRTTFEREDIPVTIVTTINMHWDAYGNITESSQKSETPGDESQSRTLVTKTDFATDRDKRFLAMPWRISQFDGTGRLLATLISYYDDAPEGQTGRQGLVTRRTCLALTDQQAQATYGDNQPEFAELGYFRREGEPGWWVDRVRYERFTENGRIHGRVTGPRAAVTVLDFDADGAFPAHVTDPVGNTVLAEHNYRVSRVSQLTDPSGAVHVAAYDALARPLFHVEPGDSIELPTVSFEARIAPLPVSVTVRRRAVCGQPETVDGREFYDGAERLLERRVRDATGEIVVLSQQFNSRGMLARTFLAARATSPVYASPDSEQPHTQYTYDALGRVVIQTNPDRPDRSFRRLSYGPGWLEEEDEEDTRDDPNASHRNTPTRTWFDSTGRVRWVDLLQGEHRIRSTYEYDVQGNLIRFTDAVGQAVVMAYDCQGQLLQVERPERGIVTVYDAAGDVVESRGRDGSRVMRKYDACRRPTVVQLGSRDSAPVIRYTYHDAGEPTPHGANEYSLGRCIRIDDEGGATRFAYDARGRMIRKSCQPAGSEREYDLSFIYRADGQLTSLTYPDSAQTTLTYHYDPRGQLVAVSPILPRIDSDIRGRRTLLQFANGVEQHIGYEELRQGVADIKLMGPHGSLRTVTLQRDRVGNVVRIDSPDSPDSPNHGLAGSFAYDDLYRLISAQLESGEAWSYAYDDVGNLTHKSDRGEYRYGEEGAPSTCLTSAGDWKFTYTPMGIAQTTPWGQQSSDPFGRLSTIVKAQNRVEFVYDYAGRRVAERRTAGDGPAIERLTPDPFFAVEAGRLVLNLFDGHGIVAWQIEGEAPRFLHSDHLGSLVAVTSSDGVLLNELRYDPFGALLRSRENDIALSIGFTGGVPEPDSGLLYLGARYYHPHLGRFISPDAVVQDIHDPLTWAAYTYCRNNPLLYADPTGHGFWDIFTAVVTIVAVVITSVATLGIGGLIIVGAAMLAGGLIGGVRAAERGGGFMDILTGALTGAAVGGTIALSVMTCGAGFAAQLGQPAFWGGVAKAALNGAINGALTGAGTGFVSGLAGGRGSLDAAINGALQGALSGAQAGAIAGAAYGAVNQVKDPQLQETMRKALAGSIQPPPTNPLSSGTFDQMPDPSRWVKMAQGAATHEVNELRNLALNQLQSLANGGQVQSLIQDTLSIPHQPGLDRLQSALNATDGIMGPWRGASAAKPN